ncbi:hypothetical protein LUZ60_003222 [Juncus effusus]|nr:hypothetical protein LUZ60_003222 [Juncus effusus]
MAKPSKNPSRKPRPSLRSQPMETEKELQKQLAMGVSSAADLRRIKITNKKAKSGGFESLGLCYEVFNGVKRKGYRVPTPIQRKTMPLILAGLDVVAMARTGSGKTAAFLIPMLQKLRHHVPQAGVRALILSPTRDLAIQTLRFSKELGKFTDLRTSLLVGGDSMETQFEELTQSPDIIIATPGRLMHHLSEVDDMSLKTVEYVVFDEADMLFSMGFAEQLHAILAQLSDARQTLLFSATMPSALAQFAKAGLRDPQLIRLDLETKISPDLTTVFLTLRQEEKHAALLYLVRERISSDQQSLIFVSTKHHVEFLNILFREEGIEPAISYGDMDQDARKIHISKFRARKSMLLIVTDVAARGLDIPLLDNVINYDFPPKPKIFIHRVGRVARAGRTGTAYSFVTSDDFPYLLDLHLFLSKPIKPAPSEEEVLKDPNSIYQKYEGLIAKGETIYGKFPQPLLDLVADRVKEIVNGSAELAMMVRTCNNAFRLYNKTKPDPSRESIRRSKDLKREGIHLIFRGLVGDDELSALAFTEKLKSFRPKQTVLEAEGDAAKVKHSKGWLEVMRKKREIHEGVIKLVHEKKSNDLVVSKEEENDNSTVTWEKKDVLGAKRKAKSFKDEEYYISSIPPNQHLEAGLSIKGNDGFVSSGLDAAVLDLVADDSSSLHKQKTQYHWDKRSKKYIKLNNGDRVTATGKIKTEGGVKVTANKTGIYEKWKKNSHRKVSLSGNPDGPTESNPISQDGNNRFMKGRSRWSVPNKQVPSELKNPDQVRKIRQQKAVKIERLKSKKDTYNNNYKGGKGNEFKSGGSFKGGKGNFKKKGGGKDFKKGGGKDFKKDSSKGKKFQKKGGKGKGQR